MKANSITLSTSARSAIASAYVAGLSASENSGSLLHTVCEVGARFLKGAQMGDDDVMAISANIASAKGWKGAAMHSRVSEVRIMLRSLHVLPDAMKAFRKHRKNAIGGCTWHDGMKLARKLAKGETVDKAVTAAFKKKNTGTPEGRLAGALAGIVDTLTGAKRKALVNAVRMLTDASVIEFTGKNAAKFLNA